MSLETHKRVEEGTRDAESDDFSFQRYTRSLDQTRTGLFVNSAEFLYPSRLPRREALLILFYKRSGKQAAVYECSYAMEAGQHCYFVRIKNIAGNLEFSGEIGPGAERGIATANSLSFDLLAVAPNAPQYCGRLRCLFLGG